MASSVGIVDSSNGTMASIGEIVESSNNRVASYGGICEWYHGVEWWNRRIVEWNMALNGRIVELYNGIEWHRMVESSNR